MADSINIKEIKKGDLLYQSSIDEFFIVEDASIFITRTLPSVKGGFLNYNWASTSFEIDQDGLCDQYNLGNVDLISILYGIEID